MKKYQLIVIGAGVSGLSTAIAWLTWKKGPVLVLEKEPVPGGCVASFRRDRYRFETVQLAPDLNYLMGWLGVYCAFSRFTGTLARLHLVRDGRVRGFTVPADLHAFERQLRETWPAEAEAIDSFFGWCDAVHQDMSRMSLEQSPFTLIKSILTCPHAISVSRKTWKEFLARFRFKDPELIETLDVFSSIAEVSGDIGAAMITIAVMRGTLSAGWRIEPSCSSLPEAMRRRVMELGGELRMNTRVAKVLSAEGRVQGVLTAAGEEIYGNAVVSTVDTKTLIESLLDETSLKKARAPWSHARENLTMSQSMISIHLGLDDDIDLGEFGIDGAYNVLTTGRSAHEAAFLRWRKGEAAPPIDPQAGYPSGGPPEDFHVTFYSPSLASGDTAQTLVIRVSPVYGPPWVALRERDRDAYLRAKDAAAAQYIALIERYLIPGLAAHIRLRDISTPATFARYLGNRDGSCYDALASVSQFGIGRLPMRGPVEGLYQTKFSHGIWPAMHAGMQVVDIVTSGAVMKRRARFRPGQGER